MRLRPDKATAPAQAKRSTRSPLPVGMRGSMLAGSGGGSNIWLSEYYSGVGATGAGDHFA